MSTLAVVACRMCFGPAEMSPPYCEKFARGWLTSSTVHSLSRARVASALPILVMMPAFFPIVSSSASFSNRTFFDSIAPIESTTTQETKPLCTTSRAMSLTSSLCSGSSGSHVPACLASSEQSRPIARARSFEKVPSMLM